MQRYDLMIGPRYQLATLGRNAVCARVVWHHAHACKLLTIGFRRSKKADTAFAMALGGGVDIHASEHIDIRPIMVDWVPTFFNGKRQDNLRVGAGIKIR